MNVLTLPATLRKSLSSEHLGLRRSLVLAIGFFCGLCAIALHRYFVFYASYDQGLFNQLFWNTLHGRWFQSSLTSANSIASIKDGATPTVSFVHLGQHFVVDFLLWVPLYGLFQSSVFLIVLQVGLMTIAGLVLYALARHSLSPQLSLWITGSYYSAIAVITPTLDNFYEHCQMPLFSFGALLAMEKQRWGWFWLMAALILGIREESGVILFGIGTYLLLSRRHPKLGLAVCLVSVAYMAVVTSWGVPQFSTDSSRLYLASRFQQFVDSDHPTIMQVLWGMATHPIVLLQSVFTPLDRRINYLLGQFAPLALVPALSGAAWTIAGFPLLSLFVQSGKSALSLQIRYAVAVVPGVFYGAILWWQLHPHWFTPKFRRFWQFCIGVSLIFALIGTSVNRSLAFVIPDSIQPWVHVPIAQQWSHAYHLRQLLSQIPEQASVSATTYLIPQLSRRRAIIRLPKLEIYDDRSEKIKVDYVVADFRQMQNYMGVFKNSQTDMASVLPVVKALVDQNQYGVAQVEDGAVLLIKDRVANPTALATWQTLSQTLDQELQGVLKERR